jgi:hypothetical protein
MSYERGDVTKLRNSTKTAAGTPYDPDDITLLITRPNGEVEERTYPPSGDIVREGVGLFYAVLDLTEDGSWLYRWLSQGQEIGDAAAGNLFVGPDAFFDPFPDEDFTVADIWARSAMLKGRYPGGIGDGDLVLGVAATAPLVASITGRNIAGKEDGEDVPPHLHELALRAIALKTEQFLQAVGSVKLRKSSLSRGNLASFSAGSYSESYFGPGQMTTAKKLDADPVLAEVLWALCTDQAKLEWLQLWEPDAYPSGEMSVTAFEYGNRPNYSSSPGGLPSVLGPAPDGW